MADEQEQQGEKPPEKVGPVNDDAETNHNGGNPLGEEKPYGPTDKHPQGFHVHKVKPTRRAPSDGGQRPPEQGGKHYR